MNDFYLSCNYQDRHYISEIRICYDLAEPGNEKQVKCFDKDLNSEKSSCEYPIRLAQKYESEHDDSDSCQDVQAADNSRNDLWDR